MLMQKLSTTLVLLICLFGASQVAAAITDADELAQLLNNFQTMRANFEQSLVNNKGTRIGQKTTGLMMLERPGKFRWEIKQPNKMLIILNKNRSILYDADLAQVVKRKMGYQNPGNPAMLLSSSTEALVKSFKIVKLKTPGKGTWFELTPKTSHNQENGYQWIKINFINKQLNAMSISDNLGQRTVINFSNVVFNLKIQPKMFLFTPPPNVEVFNES